MQAAKRVAKNTGILYAKMAITVFISLYTTRLILEALGVKDFGIFNVVGGAVSMLGFLNASMSSATQRFMSYAQGAGNSSRLNQIFNASLLLHLLVAGLLLIILEVAGYFFFKGILNITAEKIHVAKLIYQFMIISTLFTVISVPYDAVINSRENMLLFAILGIIESVFKLIIALYIKHIGEDKLMFYGLLMAALSVFLLLIRRYYCSIKYTESKIDIRKQYNKKLMKEMTGFAGWSFLGSSTSMIAFYGQGIVLNVFFGTAINAAQGIANQVSGQLSTFATTMLTALNPTIDKSEGAGDRTLMLQTAMTGSKVSFFLLMLMFVPVLVEMPYLLTIWLKNVPPSAIIFCKLLLLKNLIEQLFITLVSSIAAVGNIRKFQLFSSIITFFPLLITYLLYSIGYPPYTLYVVFIIYTIISSINILYFANTTCGLSIPFFLKQVVCRCVISFLLGFIVSLIPLYLMPGGIIRLMFVTVISFISFILLVWNIGLTKIERIGIIEITAQKRNYLLLKTKMLSQSLNLN